MTMRHGLRSQILTCALAAAACSSSSSQTGDATPHGDGANDGGPVIPTASSWLGVNVAGDLPWADITHQLSPFDTAAAQRDAAGYPVAGASGASQTDMGFVLPTGTYNISYKGTGTLAVSGIASVDGPWQAVGDEQRATLSITGTPGAFGNFLRLQITNAPGQTVTDVHVYFPGVAYDTSAPFLPRFLQLLAPFKTMRFMGWQNTNGSALASWADRASPAQFGAQAGGVPVELIAELVNETGKDAWLCVPEHATDDFIHSFAQQLGASLDFERIAAARHATGLTTPFELIVENSNENWNTGFSAYQTFLTAANADVARYTGVYDGTYGPSFMSGSGDLMRVGQYEADRLTKIGQIFRQELGAHADSVAPVLSGWALGAVYSDVGLRFIQANYGDPKQYVRYIAQAPYFSPDDAQTGALDTLFTSANANIASMDATFTDFAQLGSDYGIAIAAYEGGQGMGGTTNQPIKHLAQHDQRMYDTYTAYYARWKQHFGKSLFCHFELAGTPGVPEFIFQYGYWGSIISLQEDPAVCEPDLPTLTGSEEIQSVIHHCPKYRALAEQALP